jgi:ATP-dependent DNA helicase RecG
MPGSDRRVAFFAISETKNANRLSLAEISGPKKKSLRPANIQCAAARFSLAKQYVSADPQLIEGDNFRMIISVPEFGENPAKPARIVPAAQVTPEVTGEVTGEVTSEVVQFLRVLAEGARTRSEAQAKLGLKGQANFRDRYLVLAMDAGLVEMTLPDKPNSRLQKYRLTDKGRAWLAQTKR